MTGLQPATKADLALDEWISRIDHGSQESRTALDDVFRLFAEEKSPRQVRRLTPAALVRRLAIYRIRRTRSIGGEWRFPPDPPRPAVGTFPHQTPSAQPQPSDQGENDAQP